MNKRDTAHMQTGFDALPAVPAIHLSVIARRVLLALLLTCGLSAQAQPPAIKMAVTAAFVSERGMPVYREIARYLGDKLKRKATLVSGVSYSEANQLLERDIIQIGFVCGLPYVEERDKGNFTLVAIPVVAKHKADYPGAKVYESIPEKYYSYTIVRKDSPLNSWADLRGKSYAYNEQNSNSGYNMPRYKLVQLGARSWRDYFSRVVVSGSHEESIRMVARGEVDASSVDSMVFDYDRSIGNPDALKVRIIETLFRGGAGAPPVVMSSRSDPRLRKQVEQVFVNMDKDPRGRQILKKALLLRFDPPNDANYNDIRRMRAAARKAGFQDPH
jgi:phosphonate transport system substrate-binding protein